MLGEFVSDYPKIGGLLCTEMLIEHGYQLHGCLACCFGELSVNSFSEAARHERKSISKDYFVVWNVKSDVKTQALSRPLLQTICPWPPKLTVQIQLLLDQPFKSGGAGLLYGPILEGLPSACGWLCFFTWVLSGLFPSKCLSPSSYMQKIDKYVA